MKTLYTLLTWMFGLYAFSMMFAGVLLPAVSGRLESPEYGFFLFMLAIPFALLALFFRNKGQKREWNDDFFICFLNFHLQKVKNLKPH